MIELKPCPFCGARGEWLNEGTMRLPTGDFSYQYVACRLCGGMMIDTDRLQNPIFMYNKWNTRNKRNENYDPEAE